MGCDHHSSVAYGGRCTNLAVRGTIACVVGSPAPPRRMVAGLLSELAKLAVPSTVCAVLSFLLCQQMGQGVSTLGCLATVGVGLLCLAAALVRRATTAYDWETAPKPRKEVDDEVRKQGMTRGKLAKLADAGGVDVIVVGSGMGGLSCAATLARHGKKVLVLEQHDVAGGSTHTFFEHGYEFDTGLHYIGSNDFGLPDRAGKLDGISLLMGTLTEGCDSGPVEWTRMADAYDIALLGGENGSEVKRFELLSGRDRLEAALVAQYPAEKAAIRHYFELIVAHQLNGGIFFGHKVISGFFPNWPKLRSMLRQAMCGRYWAISDQTVQQVLDGLTDNSELKGILACQWGDYGLGPKQASFAMHSMVSRCASGNMGSKREEGRKRERERERDVGSGGGTGLHVASHLPCHSSCLRPYIYI